MFKYLILLPEILILLWLFINSYFQIIDKYEKKSINFLNYYLTSQKITLIFLFNIFVSIICIVYYINFEKIILFNNILQLNLLDIIIKIIFIIFCGISFFFILNNQEFEYFQLILLFFFSSFLLISINNLFGFYLLIELQSIIFFFLIGWTHIKVSIDFFFQSIIFSLFFVIGLFLIYGVNETFDFLRLNDLNHFLSINQLLIEKTGLKLGIMLLLITLFFKAGLFPFQTWFMRVLRTNNIILILTIGILSKFVLLFLFYKWKVFFLFDINIFLFFGILGLLVSGIGGLLQSNVINIFFFSSLTNLSLLLINLSLLTFSSSLTFLIYLNLYFLVSLNFVYYIFEFKNNLKVTQFKYFYTENVTVTVSFLILIFSLLGLPPLLGFYFKFFSVINVMLYLPGYNNMLFICYILVTNLFTLIMYLKISRSLVFGGFEEKKYFWFKNLSRENFCIELKNKSVFNTITIVSNTAILCWVPLFISIFFECI